MRTIDLGSISGAGRTYGISTSTASRRLQELEADLDVRLLDRTTRSVTPTEAGNRLYQQVTPLLSGLDEALRDASEHTEKPVGTLRLLVRRSFGMRHVVPALPDFLARYSDLTVDIQLTERVDILPGDGVDVVIRLGAPTEKSVTSYRLASNKRILCASPEYIAKHGMPEHVEDLANHACLTYRRELETATWIFDLADTQPSLPGKLYEAEVSGPLRSTSGEALLVAGLAGVGLVLLPVWVVASDIAAGRLVPCLEKINAWPAKFREEIVAVHRRSSQLPAKIQVFIEYLLQLEIEGQNDPE